MIELPFSTQRTRTKIAAPKSLCDHLRSTDISERKINVCNGLATGRDQKLEENSHFLDSRLDGGRAAKVQKAISGPTDCSGKGQSHFQGHCRRRSHYSKIAYCQCTGDVATYRVCLRAPLRLCRRSCSLLGTGPSAKLATRTGTATKRFSRKKAEERLRQGLPTHSVAATWTQTQQRRAGL